MKRAAKKGKYFGRRFILETFLLLLRGILNFSN
jgi:hypothetical protein